MNWILVKWMSVNWICNKLGIGKVDECKLDLV